MGNQKVIEVTIREGSGLGKASLILGVLAFTFCWIPLLGVISLPVAALGTLLGGAGLLLSLIRRGSSLGYCIGGLSTCGIAFFVAITVNGALANGLKSLGDGLDSAARRQTATNQQPVAKTQTASLARLAAPQIKAPPPKSPPSKPDDKPLVTEEWASAETSVRQGDMEIEVSSVVVGRVDVQTLGSSAKSKEVLLTVTVKLTNLSESKKVDYSTWGETSFSFGDNSVSMKDNFGNSYKTVNFGISEPEGRISSDSIYPEKSLTDVLIFEVPVEKATHLELALPAKNFHGTGMIRFRIPASMIRR